MDWGSSYIYDYQSSEEEELSCTELEEGMWLSDSEGEDERPPVPLAPIKVQKSSRPGFLKRMFGLGGGSAASSQQRFV